MIRKASLLQNLLTAPKLAFRKSTSCSNLRNNFTFLRRHSTLFNMGLKGFYGYCLKEVKDCHRTVNIIEEIAKYRRLAKSFVYGYLRI